MMFRLTPLGVLKLREEIEPNLIISIVISLFTCVDDGASVFNNSDDSVIGCDMMCCIMAK